MLAGDLGLVKIGTSGDIPHRMRGLQNMCPVKLTVLAAFYVGPGKPDERALHRRFAADRQHGEWFTATDEITDWAWDQGPTGKGHRKRAQDAVDATWSRRLMPMPNDARQAERRKPAA